MARSAARERDPARIEKAPRPGVIESHEAGRAFAALASSDVHSAVVTLRRREEITALPVGPGV